MKPAATPRVEKIAESSLPASSPTVEKNIPKISSREGEAALARTERDHENLSEMSLQKAESTLMPVQSKTTIEVSDSASASSPLTNSIPSTLETSEHLTSIGSGSTAVANTDLSKRSNSNKNDEKDGKKSHSLLQDQVLPSFLDPSLFYQQCT